MPIVPPTRTWTFRDREGDERTFVQSELTIDGEVQLFGLINRAVKVLTEVGFPFGEVPSVFTEQVDADSPEIDWVKATTLISIALPVLPGMASEVAAVLLGQFPTDEYGKPNKDWNEDIAYLRSTVRTADLIEMLQEFAKQNDVERMVAPFAGTIRGYLNRSPRIQAMPSGQP